jgi:predicted RNase H-like nuclease (RuvC/YqgF family)
MHPFKDPFFMFGVNNDSRLAGVVDLYEKKIKELNEAYTQRMKSIKKENTELKQYIDELVTKIRSLKENTENKTTIELLRKAKDLALKEKEEEHKVVIDLFAKYKEVKDENERLRKKLDEVLSNQKETVQLSEEEIRNIVLDALSTMIYGEMACDEE